MEKEIELKFIEQTLQSWGARLKSSLVKEISNKDLISKKGTSHLKDRINFDVSRTGINGYQLRLFFPDYGRFIEIRYYTGAKRTSELAFKSKKSSRSKISNETTSKAKLINKIANRVGRRRKDTRWYSATAYGSVNSLIVYSGP